MVGGVTRGNGLASASRGCHLASVVEVEHDHLEHVAGAVGSKDESSQRRLVVAHVGDHERMRDGVLYVVNLHTVFARRTVELHTDESYYTTRTSTTCALAHTDAQSRTRSARAFAGASPVVHGTTLSPDGWRLLIDELRAMGHSAVTTGLARLGERLSATEYGAAVAAELSGAKVDVVVAHSGSGPLLPGDRRGNASHDAGVPRSVCPGRLSKPDG